jgi:hypothetical protein
MINRGINCGNFFCRTSHHAAEENSDCIKNGQRSRDGGVMN